MLVPLDDGQARMQHAMREDDTSAAPRHHVGDDLALACCQTGITCLRENDDGTIRMNACSISIGVDARAVGGCRLAEEARRRGPVLRIGQIDEQRVEGPTPATGGRCRWQC